MSGLTIEQISTARFTTSTIADQYTKELMEGLGLSTKANVARLAIGRSLALGPFDNVGIDAKGLAIPASSLFLQEDISFWTGLIITHAQMHEESQIDTFEKFRKALRLHWHRGACLLYVDWQNCSEDFDLFLDTLMNRRAELPDVAVSADPKRSIQDEKSVDEPAEISANIVHALSDIGVQAEVKDYIHGPRVTRYKIFLPDVNQLDKLRNGLERVGLILSLGDTSPILSTGKESKTVYLDIPRPENTWDNIIMKDFEGWISSKPSGTNQLMVFPGVDSMGTPFCFDIAKAPHVLVGGASGNGKSVCLHALILSLISQHSTDTLQLALIDPKQVEFSVYLNNRYVWGDGVAIGVAEARQRILSLVQEMDERYEVFTDAGVTNIIEARQKGLSIPYIVAFVEELADLVIQDKAIEDEISRLAQLGRACGIHLVLATQRPDAQTFRGTIRGNLETRIALKVQKGTESRIILDEAGAENLLGAGDMLVKSGSRLQRVHGVYIRRDDIKAFLKQGNSV